MLTDISSSSVVSSILSMRMHVGSAVLVQAGLITQPTVFAHLTVQPSSLIAAMIVLWICWPVIEWCIGSVAWLGSWYACVAECLPMLQ
jgi:hypothetical protein